MVNSDAVVIRRAQVGEGAALADLYARARAGAYPAVPAPVHTEPEIREWMVGQLAGTIGSADLEIWVAQIDTDLVGLLILDRGWLEQLYVAPERTGQGIGAALVDHAKQRRPGGLRLWTFQSNPGAQSFYERHGFVEVDRTDGATNEERAPDICYAWRPPAVTTAPG